MPLGILNNLALVNRDHMLANGLVSWYLALPHFAGGRLWQDIGLAQNTGVLNNMGSGVGWQIKQRPGGFGACMGFDGSSSYVTATPNYLPSGSNTPITVSFWCLATTITGSTYRTPFFYGAPSATRGLIFATDGGTNDGTVDVGVVGSNFITSTKKLAVNVWTHLTLAYDGTNGRLYFNGLLDSTGAVNLGLVETVTNLGTYDQTQQYWAGSLDDIRIYWRGMSGSEVKELYDNSLAGCPGLLNRVEPTLWNTGTPQAPTPTYRLEVTSGPPMRSPWLRVMPPPQPVVPVQSVIVNATPYPETRIGPPLRGAPWFKIFPPAIRIQAPPPAQLIQTYATEVRNGPPLRGAPWLQLLPVPTALYQAPVIVPLVTAPQSYAPEIHGGPPLPGAPWFRLPIAAPTDPGARPPPPAPPPGPGVGRSHNVTLIQRDPTQQQPLRRNTEIMATIINSLVGQGLLVQTGPGTWTIPLGGGGLTGTFSSGSH